MKTAQTINLNDISREQIRKMKHALGLGGKDKPYRNYYSLTTPNQDWEDLIEKGFANKTNSCNDPDSIIYYVTFEAVKLLYSKTISKEFYDEL